MSAAHLHLALAGARAPTRDRSPRSARDRGQRPPAEPALPPPKASWLTRIPPESALPGLAADRDRLNSEVALLHQEICLKDARMAALAPNRRPHYPPIERMAILQLKAARGWSKAEAGRRFLVTNDTVASWSGRRSAIRPCQSCFLPMIGRRRNPCRSRENRTPRCSPLWSCTEADRDTLLLPNSL